METDKIRYRPLDREKQEFRLLKILPPLEPSSASEDPFIFAQDPIRCELEYVSFSELMADFGSKRSAQRNILSYLLQDIPGMPSEDKDMDTHALVDRLAGGLSRLMSVDKESTYDLGATRKAELQSAKAIFDNVLEHWWPRGIKHRTKTFEQWLGSWIWTSLSGDEEHTETLSRGYYALSYVWRDQPPTGLGTRHRELEDLIYASGMTLKQAAQDVDLEGLDLESIFGPAEESAQTVEIHVDGRPVHVGVNLAEALRALREIPEIAIGTRIWVDALCINQQDIEEKNYEVPRMGEIYNAADRVISYLGDEDDDSGHVLELMDAIGDLLQEASSVASLTLAFFRDLPTDVACAITSLLSRPYFSRIWIVQEICLGGEKSILICGARRFSWTNILRCGKMLNAGLGAVTWNNDQALDPRQRDEPVYMTWADLRNGITKLQTLRDAQFNRAQIHEEGPEGEVWATNTLWFRIPSSNKATDLRDLVYGMLSLLPPKFANAINVDYGAANNFQQVMQSLAEAHIKSSECLHWILHRYYLPFLNHKSWPSWVPNLAQRFSSAHWDWTMNLGCEPCPDIPFAVDFATDAKTGRRILSTKALKVDVVTAASGNLIRQQIKKSERTIEYLSAIITQDNVDELYPLLDQTQRAYMREQMQLIPDEPGDQSSTDEQAIHRPSESSTHQYADMAGLKTAVNEVFKKIGVELEGGQSVFNFPLDISDEDTDLLERVLTQRALDIPGVMIFNQLRDAYSDFDVFGTPFRDLFPPKAAEVNSNSYTSPVISDRTMAFAQLFTTARGYVGATIANVRAGDELYVLPRCVMPVVLQKSEEVEGAFVLRGGAYVPGLMHGQALKDVEDATKRAQVIRIC